MKHSVFLIAGILGTVTLALSVSVYADVDYERQMFEAQELELSDVDVTGHTPEGIDYERQMFEAQELELSYKSATGNGSDMAAPAAVRVPKDHIKTIQNENTLIPDSWNDAHAVVLNTVYDYPYYHHMVINPHIQAEVGESIHWYDYGIRLIGTDRQVDWDATLDSVGGYMSTSWNPQPQTDSDSYLAFSINKILLHSNDDPAFTTHLVAPGVYEWKWRQSYLRDTPMELNTISGTITVTYPEPEPTPITNQTG